MLQPISNLSTLLLIIILFAASKFVVGSTDSNVDTNMATTVNFDPSNLYPNNDLIVVRCASLEVWYGIVPYYFVVEKFATSFHVEDLWYRL